MYENGKKKKIRAAVLIIAAVIGFPLLLRSDDRQQRMYGVVRDAYTQMEAGNYDKAEQEFEEYLNSHSTKFYWTIQAFVNGNDKTSYENVQKALEECRIELQPFEG